ncbi:MAG: hypothetical protein ACTS3F_02585 [Phycisphaerales bacterium]
MDGSDGLAAWVRGPAKDILEPSFHRYVLQFGLAYAVADGYCSGCHRRHSGDASSRLNRQHIFPRALCPDSAGRPVTSVSAAGDYLTRLLSFDSDGRLRELLRDHRVIQSVVVGSARIDIINIDSPSNICLTCRNWNLDADKDVRQMQAKIRDPVLAGSDPIDLGGFVDWIEERFKVFHRSPLTIDPNRASRLFHATAISRLQSVDACQMSAWLRLLPWLADKATVESKERLRVLIRESRQLLPLKCAVRFWLEWDLWVFLTARLNSVIAEVRKQARAGVSRTVSDVLDPWLKTFTERILYATYVENIADSVMLAAESCKGLTPTERAGFTAEAWKRGDTKYWKGLVEVLRVVIRDAEWPLATLSPNPHTG